MIARILGEGQYRLDSIYLDHLSEIDRRLVPVIASGTDEDFRLLFHEMLAIVRTHGQMLPLDEFVASDIILPDPSSHVDDIKPLFLSEGPVSG